MWKPGNLTGTRPTPAYEKLEPPETWTEVGLIKKIYNRCLSQKALQLAPPSTCIWVGYDTGDWHWIKFTMLLPILVA